ncbi:hypothetical protein PMKS-000463 [Pichia membranifaciens]|uniref:Uncharacterized protein n=1 Tax=Pichia membranifaciens TaxID=4926 RepID=A0A1Q2YBT9_9ASCO|nr:hypothetical protein PMKS-000463 [Pichia membranifaciens]
MPIVESPAIYVQSVLTTIATYFIQHAYVKPIIDLHSTDANFIPLDKPTKALHIRRDNSSRQTKVNVFDNKGDKLYTIERESASTPTWSMFTYPHRHEVATIRAGFFLKSFDFHNKFGMQHRVLERENGLSGRLRTFYLNDGYKYVWTRGSKFLERVTNPGGNEEETRERIAKVRLMRQRKFDYELVVDENKVDLEVAIVTGFLCMMTFWGMGDITETVGPTYIPEPKAPEVKAVEPAAVKQEPIVIEKVIERIIEKAPAASEVKKESVPNITFEVQADDDADVIIEKA